MFEEGLRDNIKIAVGANLFSDYARFVERARKIERATMKTKMEKAQEIVEVKDEEPKQDKERNNENGKRSWQQNKNNGNGDTWKKYRNRGEQRQDFKFIGHCYDCKEKGYRAADCPNPKVENDSKGEFNARGAPMVGQLYGLNGQTYWQLVMLTIERRFKL